MFENSNATIETNNNATVESNTNVEDTRNSSTGVNVLRKETWLPSKRMPKLLDINWPMLWVKKGNNTTKSNKNATVEGNNTTESNIIATVKINRQLQINTE